MRFTVRCLTIKPDTTKRHATDIPRSTDVQNDSQSARHRLLLLEDDLIRQNTTLRFVWMLIPLQTLISKRTTPCLASCIFNVRLQDVVICEWTNRWQVRQNLRQKRCQTLYSQIPIRNRRQNKNNTYD